VNSIRQPAARALVIDNYDSFTYNIVSCLFLAGAQVTVLQNTDDIELAERARPTHIVLSAGGGDAANPADFGNSGDVLARFAGRVPVLGICLGHQIIARYLGGQVGLQGDVRHGRVSRLRLTAPSVLLHGMTEGTDVMRYHSSALRPDSLPAVARVTSVAADDNAVMSVEVPEERLFGVQFHPESIATPQGMLVFSNFLAGWPTEPEISHACRVSF
jgi:anthranilate synthase component 2